MPQSSVKRMKEQQEMAARLREQLQMASMLREHQHPISAPNSPHNSVTEVIHPSWVSRSVPQTLRSSEIRPRDFPTSAMRVPPLKFPSSITESGRASGAEKVDAGTNGRRAHVNGTKVVDITKGTEMQRDEDCDDVDTDSEVGAKRAESSLSVSPFVRGALESYFVHETVGGNTIDSERGAISEERAQAGEEKKTSLEVAGFIKEKMAACLTKNQLEPAQGRIVSTLPASISDNVGEEGECADEKKFSRDSTQKSVVKVAESKSLERGLRSPRQVLSPRHYYV